MSLLMVKAAALYAVRVGRVPGIYNTWAECEPQVKDFPGPQYKKLSTLDEAQAFMSRNKFAPPPRPQISSAAVADDDSGSGLVVFTDGACKNNQGGGASKLAGLGVYFGDGDQRNIAERVPGDQTNNRAELLALIRALEVISLEEPVVILKTDSQYSINCMTKWIDGWRNRGWKLANGMPVANVPLIRYLHALIETRKAAGCKVELMYVKAHTGIAGNEAADRLANEGCIKPPSATEPDWDALSAALKRGSSAIEPSLGGHGGATLGYGTVSSSRDHLGASINKRTPAVTSTPKQEKANAIPSPTDSDDELWDTVSSYPVLSQSSSFTPPTMEDINRVHPDGNVGPSFALMPVKSQIDAPSPNILQPRREAIHCQDQHVAFSTSSSTSSPSIATPSRARHGARPTQQPSSAHSVTPASSAPPNTIYTYLPTYGPEPTNVVMRNADDAAALPTPPAEHSHGRSSTTVSPFPLLPDAIEALARAHVAAAEEEATQLQSLISHVKTLQRTGRLKDQELLTRGAVLHAKELEPVAKDAELRAKDAELVALRHQLDHTRTGPYRI